MIGPTLPGSILQRKRSTWGCWTAALALAAGMPAGSLAAPQLDFLLFPAVEWRDDSDVKPAGAALDDHLFASVNLFATISADHFQFLGEWFFTEDGDEIQRLQFGWKFGSRDTIWLGRYHTPISYWNSAYHHGTYLQTSVSRPGIIEFEGGEGPLPTHYTGLLWEGSRSLSRGAVHYAVALGAGPTLNGKLDPLDVADPEDDHDAGLMVNLNWRPRSHDRNMIGVFGAKTQIEDEARLFDHIDQWVFGAYVNWHWPHWRLLGAWIDVNNEIDRLGDDDFSAGYLQAEFSPGEHWTPYARYETTRGENPDAPFLGRLDGFILERALAGIRFELTSHQALTLEISSLETVAGESDRIVLQWSAYFP
ncbi:MAG: hypothetical protein R3200_15605 [Xanthomonadales bacterium]|nr:hypothetical protein [Xanthomonadales bacterium]